jgi:hypothetical protein
MSVLLHRMSPVVAHRFTLRRRSNRSLSGVKRTSTCAGRRTGFVSPERAMPVSLIATLQDLVTTDPSASAIEALEKIESHDFVICLFGFGNRAHRHSRKDI